MTEQWKPVTGYEGQYRVSDTGLVAGVTRKLVDGRTYKGRMLRPSGRKEGHTHVVLSHGAEKRTYQVARLVYTAFVGPIPTNHRVFFKDGDPKNNHVSNLALHVPCPNTDPKLEPRDKERIRALRNQGIALKEIASFFGVSDSFVSMVATVKR